MIGVRTISAEQTHPLRKTVLWPDLALNAQGVEGDEAALHLGAFDTDRLIGVASFFPGGQRVRLRKLAVAEACRGRGLGARLVRDGAARMWSAGCCTLWCDARVGALGFYERLGFAVTGAVFDKAGVAYRVASLDLRREGGPD